MSPGFQPLDQQSEAAGQLLAEVAARAERGDAQSQYALGRAFELGTLGLPKDHVEAVKWFRKAAEQNHAGAQYHLGGCYATGEGVAQDYAEAAKWCRRAADQNDARAQYNLGGCYLRGVGVGKDYAEAVRWFRKAAEQNHAGAQYWLGYCYYCGQSVPEDWVEACKWMLLAAAGGSEEAKQFMTTLEGRISREGMAKGLTLARDFEAREAPPADSGRS